MEPTPDEAIEDVETDPSAIVEDVEAVTEEAASTDAEPDLAGPYAMEDLLALFEDLDVPALRTSDPAEGEADAPEVERIPELLETLERAAAAADDSVDPDREIGDETVAALVEAADHDGADDVDPARFE